MPDSPGPERPDAQATLDAGITALLALVTSYLEGEDEAPDDVIQALGGAASWLQERLRSDEEAGAARLGLAGDAVGLRFIDVYDAETAFLAAATDEYDDEHPLEDPILAAREDADGFDALPLEERLARLALDMDDRVAAIARLVARGPGYSPMEVDPDEEDELAPMAAATAIAAAVMAAYHVVAFTHDDEREIVLEGRIRRLVDLAARSLGVLDAEDRARLRDPWTPQGRFLRAALAATELDDPVVHWAAHLVAPALYAGLTAGDVELLADDEEDEEIDADERDGRAEEAQELARCLEDAVMVLAEREPEDRAQGFRADPPALAFALGLAWRRYADGPDWVAPWSPEWPEHHARDDRDAERRA
jgi:hypothetical protein